MVLQPCKNKQVKHIYIYISIYIPTCWDICWDTIQNDREKNQKILQVCHLVQGIRLSGHGWNWRRFSVLNGSLSERVKMSSACGQLITPGSLTTWMVLQPCKNKQVKHIYLYIPTCYMLGYMLGYHSKWP